MSRYTSIPKAGWAHDHSDIYINPDKAQQIFKEQDIQSLHLILQ